MANNGNKEKKTLEVDIDAKTYDRLQEYSENTDKSVSSVVNEGINAEITRCEVGEGNSVEKVSGGRAPSKQQNLQGYGSRTSLLDLPTSLFRSFLGNNI